MIQEIIALTIVAWALYKAIAGTWSMVKSNSDSGNGCAASCSSACAGCALRKQMKPGMYKGAELSVIKIESKSFKSN